MKVHKKIAIAILLIAVAVAGYILYPREFKVREDEIALRIQMDTKEDIGLLVYDYNIAGHDYSGGISNTDRSLIGHDEELIVTWNDEELKIKTEEDIPFKITFRIITEYTDPNYENNYPEGITVYLDPIEWTAHLGEEYEVRITGDSTNGYEAQYTDGA